MSSSLGGEEPALVVAALAFAARGERNGNDEIDLEIRRQSRHGQTRQVGGQVALVRVLEPMDGLEDRWSVGVWDEEVVDAALLKAATRALVAVGQGASALAALGVGKRRGRRQAGLAEGGAGAAAGGTARREEGGGEGSAGGAEAVGG